MNRIEFKDLSLFLKCAVIGGVAYFVLFIGLVFAAILINV